MPYTESDQSKSGISLQGIGGEDSKEQHDFHQETNVMTTNAHAPEWYMVSVRTPSSELQQMVAKH